MESRPFILLTLLLTIVLFFDTGCRKEDESGGPGIITTLVLTFTNPDGQTAIYQAVNLDGLGSGGSSADEIRLRPATEYVISVFFLDESGRETRIVTEEILAAAEQYLLCLAVTGPLLDPISQDLDANGAPLGLTSTLTTTENGAGTLRVRLQRDADKGAADPCLTGRTEIDQTLEVRVE